MQNFFKTHSDVIITALTKPEHLCVCNNYSKHFRLVFFLVVALDCLHMLANFT